MLNKQEEPTMEQMTAYCGDCRELFTQLNGWLSGTYGTVQAITFPYGNQYGWSVALEKIKIPLWEWRVASLSCHMPGGSSMVNVGAYLDNDGDGTVTKAEYEADPFQVTAQFGTFEELDINSDDEIDQTDFEKMLKEIHDETFRAFDGGDDLWLKENYGVRLTSAWFQAHRKLPPNRETQTNVYVDSSYSGDREEVLAIVKEAKDRVSAFWDGTESFPPIIISDNERTTAKLWGAGV